MDALETIYNRKQTTAMIKADGYQIPLNRRTFVPDDAGGRTEVNTPLPPQLVRIVPARTRSTSLTYTLPTGEVIASKDMFLLGQWDMDVEKDDWFTWKGRAFQISYIEPDRTFQTLCQVDEMGEDERSTY